MAASSSTSCSLCGATGVNKLSCPLNPQAVNPQPSKHLKSSLAQQMEADWIRLQLPAVPKTYQPIEKSISDNCSLCLRFINSKATNKESTMKRWAGIHQICDKCANEIAKQYQKDIKNNTHSRYKKYHKSTTAPTLNEINLHGSSPNNSYYNSTMYEGARYWSDLALIRRLP